MLSPHPGHRTSQNRPMRSNAFRYKGQVLPHAEHLQTTNCRSWLNKTVRLLQQGELSKAPSNIRTTTIRLAAGRDTATMGDCSKNGGIPNSRSAFAVVSSTRQACSPGAFAVLASTRSAISPRNSNSSMCIFFLQLFGCTRIWRQFSRHVSFIRAVSNRGMGYRNLGPSLWGVAYAAFGDGISFGTHGYGQFAVTGCFGCTGGQAESIERLYCGSGKKY